MIFMPINLVDVFLVPLSANEGFQGYQ